MRKRQTTKERVIDQVINNTGIRQKGHSCMRKAVERLGIVQRRSEHATYLSQKRSALGRDVCFSLRSSDCFFVIATCHRNGNMPSDSLRQLNLILRKLMR